MMLIIYLIRMKLASPVQRKFSRVVDLKRKKQVSYLISTIRSLTIICSIITNRYTYCC